MGFLKYLIEFIVLFLVVYLYYKIFDLKLYKKLDNKKHKKEMPEVRLFINLFKIDIKHINYQALASKVALIVSFNLAFSVTLGIELFDSLLLKILVSFVSLFLTTYVGFNLLNLYYQKKGMKKNV